MRAGSPVGSGHGPLGPSSAIPNLSLDAGAEAEDREGQSPGGADDGSVRGWLSKVVGRGRGEGVRGGQGQYLPLGQQEGGEEGRGGGNGSKQSP